jgi:hypothetical protein
MRVSCDATEIAPVCDDPRPAEKPDRRRAEVCLDNGQFFLGLVRNSSCQIRSSVILLRTQEQDGRRYATGME